MVSLNIKSNQLKMELPLVFQSWLWKKQDALESITSSHFTW